MEFLAGVGASLVASGIAFILGYFFKGQQYKAKYRAAPKVYLENLEKLISDAIHDGPFLMQE